MFLAQWFFGQGSFVEGVAPVYAAANFCHNHPPTYPGDLYRKLARPSVVFARGGFVGVGPEGRALSAYNFCHFWNFHYDRKNWRLITLWGLFVALKVYTFLRKLFKLRLNQAEKNQDDFSA